MNLLEKLISSPWFWADIFLSVLGGFIVAWGLSVEKKAEKMLPPDDFKKDIFGDLVAKYKAEEERGWRILMAGIIIEVVAALVISVISSLEIADSNEKAGQAEMDAGQANLQVGVLSNKTVLLSFTLEGAKSNNLVLQSRVLELEAKAADRHISEKQKKDFIKSLGDTPRAAVFMAVRHPNLETINYANDVQNMLIAAGFTIAGNQNFADDVSIFNGNSDIGIFFDRLDDMTPYTIALNKAFIDAGLHPTAFLNSSNRVYQANEIHPSSNQVFILVRVRLNNQFFDWA